MSPELKARFTLGDPTLWLIQHDTSLEVAHPFCIAEEDVNGGLTWHCDLTYREWAYAHATPNHDISIGLMAYHKLHWVVPPPWLKE